MTLAAQLPTNQIHSNIEIKITEYLKREDNLRGYHVYVIKGNDNQGFIDVQRRYNDFFLIRRLMTQKWPGCYIPPLPPKDVLKKMDPYFVAARKSALEVFLRKVADLPYLHYSSEYQVFLRSTGASMEQALKGYSIINYDDMIQRFAVNFQELAMIQQTSEAPLLVSRFRSFLYKISGTLKVLRATSKEIAKAKKKFYEGMAAFQNHVALEYERDVIGEYVNFTNQRNVFCDVNTTELTDKAAKMKEAINNQSLEYFDTWIAEEVSDVRTLLEAIDQKERFEGIRRAAQKKQKDLTSDLQDITAGNFNWKTVFSSKPKDQIVTDIHAQLANIAKDIENLATLIDMITLVISHIEIDKFKKSKSEKFYKIVGIAAQNELDNLSNMAEYWNIIAAKNNQ